MESQDQVLKRIQSTMARTLKNGASLPPVTRDTTADQVQGWDSLTHAILMMAIEREFGLKLPIEETLDMDNVGDLVDMIQKSAA